MGVTVVHLSTSYSEFRVLANAVGAHWVGPGDGEGQVSADEMDRVLTPSRTRVGASSGGQLLPGVIEKSGDMVDPGT